MESSDSEAEYEVQEIVDKRKRGRILEYKVKWKGYDSDEDAWIPKSQLSSSRDVLAAFEKSLKTKENASRVVKKETSRSVKKVEGGGTKTTTTITTEDTMSAPSSPDSSPVLRRRTERREEVTVSSSSTKDEPNAVKSTSGCVIAKLQKMQWSFYIFILSLLIIALTFVMEDLFK